MRTVRRRRDLARRALRLLWPLLRLVVGFSLRSWRLRVIGNTDALDPRRPGPAVFAFWHGELLPCGAALQRRCVRHGGSVTALVSRSADGEILARAAAEFGFATVRGSTSRGGLSALRSLRREVVREQRSVAVVPDGPRGPAGRAKAGVIQLAAVTGTPIVPMAAAVSCALRVGSWDRMLIPLPFARLTVAVGPELSFDRRAPVESGVERLEAQLRELAELVGASK